MQKKLLRPMAPKVRSEALKGLWEELQGRTKPSLLNLEKQGSVV